MGKRTGAMTAADELFSIRRILVALDPATPAAALLDASVAFARQVEAELEGLFVEDIDLMRLAELPFAHFLSLPAGLPQPLDLASLEREMRFLAAGARQALETRAREMNVRCSFRVVRGHLEAEVRTAEAADLVILDRSGATVTRYLRLGAAAGVAALGAARSVLLVSRRPAAIESLVTAYDGSPGADRALGAAARLASRVTEAGAAPPAVFVLCLGATKPEAAKAEKKARGALERHGVAATFRTLTAPGAAELTAALRASANALLVLPAELPLLASEEGERLLAESDGAVLLVR